MSADWTHEWPPDRLAEVAGTSFASYADPCTPVFVHAGFQDRIEVIEPIVPRTIIDLDGLCLVESFEDLDDWWMGSQRPDGSIYCWARYGYLETALRAL